MDSNNRALARYFKQINRELPNIGKGKKQVVSRIRENVTGYLEENKDATIEMVICRFGTAEEIAEAYIATADGEKLKTSLKLRKRIIGIVAATAAVILLLWGIVVGWAAIEAHISSGGYITDVITEDTPRPIER